MRFPPVHTWLLRVAIVGSLGCPAATGIPAVTDEVKELAVAPPEPSESAHPEPPSAQEEQSVKPGINDPYYHDDALDRYSRILEAETREIVRRRFDIIDAIGLEAGMVVSDIGAGTGLLTAGIAKEVGPQGRVYAVDIVPVFLDRIRERVRAEGLSNVTVVRGEDRATGLGLASLDLAFMCDTYHHIEYPGAYMRSLFGTVRSGGTLVLVDMKRPAGEAGASVRRHVRADKATVIAEVEQAGFVFESEIELLQENYYLRFRRP